MAGGFDFVRRKTLKASPLWAETGKASTGFKPKDALIYTEGQIDRAVAASKVIGILNTRLPRVDEMRKPSGATAENTTAACEKIEFMHAMGGNNVFQTSLTGEGLEVSSAAMSNNGTTTTALVNAAALAAGDLDGGVIYFHDTDKHHNITNDAKAGNEHTLTFSPARDVAPVAGALITVFPKGPGYNGVKLSAVEAAQGIDPTVAGMSGGNCRIEGMNLNPKVFTVDVSFPDVE